MVSRSQSPRVAPPSPGAGRCRSGDPVAASPASSLRSRHCGRGEGAPHVLGLRGPGRAAVSVGQGKTRTTQRPQPRAACPLGHFSPGDTPSTVPPVPGKATEAPCFLPVSSSVTAVFLRLPPGSVPAPMSLPKIEDSLGPFGLGDFAGNPPGRDKQWLRNGRGAGTAAAGCLASPPGPESPLLGPFPLFCLRTCSLGRPLPHQERVSSEAHSGCLLPGVGLGYFWDSQCDAFPPTRCGHVSSAGAGPCDPTVRWTDVTPASGSPILVDWCPQHQGHRCACPHAGRTGACAPVLGVQAGSPGA